MNRISRFVLAGLAAFAVDAQAAQLGPTRASQLVRLQATLGTSPFCTNFGVKFDKKLEADGTQTTFAGVPPGQVLVITDLSFDMSGVSAGQAVVGTVEVETASTFAPLMSAIGEVRRFSLEFESAPRV